MPTRRLQLAPNLTLPLDAVTQTFLVVGKRGSGKSNTAARFVEQLHHAKIPFVVLDPVDTWWGLKASRTGEKGLDVYVFGGRKADLPLEARGGALIAEVLCEHRLSMVLSVKHLSGRERSDFMVDFARTLFQKWAGGPLHVVLEEAHELAPQNVQTSREGEQQMLGAFKRLWKLGRSAGIGGTAVTQRPASLSKDITTQSEILIAHRTIGPQDVKAIGEWVKYHGERLDMLADLPTLPTGDAFVWAPEFPEGHPIGLQRTTILLRETYDSASTPKVGESRVEPKELAAVDLERLRAKMAATIEKAKADDPRELRKQIAELKAALIKVSKTGSIEIAHAQNIDRTVLTDADRARLDTLHASIESIASLMHEDLILAGQRMTAALDRVGGEYGGAVIEAATKAENQLRALLDKASVQRVLGKLSTIAPEIPPRPAGRITPARPLVPPAGAVSPGGSRNHARPADQNGAISPARQRLLNGVAFLHGIGVMTVDKTQLALIVGVSPSSGSYFNNLGALRSAGFLDYPTSGTVALTSTGAAIAQTDGVPSTTRELHDAIRMKLPPAKWKILAALIAAYPNALAKDALAEQIAVSPSSGSYFNNLGSLRSLGVITYPRPSEAAAAPVLFLDA